MPSRFEPCGLNQMYSLRYGTVPLVQPPGGFTTRCGISTPRTGEGTGFTFDEYSPQALLDTLRWALERLSRIVDGVAAASGQAAMRQDHSWDASAREYVKVYERAAVQRVWA